MPGAQASAAADQACADRCRHEPATKTGPLLQALLQDQEVTPGGSKTVTCVAAGHRFVSPAMDWWPGAGSNRRPSAFQADARTNRATALKGRRPGPLDDEGGPAIIAQVRCERLSSHAAPAGGVQSIRDTRTIAKTARDRPVGIPRHEVGRAIRMNRLARLGRMVRRAMTVLVRSPPPSCRSTIEPARVWPSTLLMITCGGGCFQSHGSTAQWIDFMPRLAAMLTVWALHRPPGLRKYLMGALGTIACMASLVFCISAMIWSAGRLRRLRSWLQVWLHRLWPSATIRLISSAPSATWRPMTQNVALMWCSASRSRTWPVCP